MKVKLEDVNKMIKEEFQKMLEKKKLSSRLSQINEELSQMNEEDSALNEVEAGGETTVASHGWTGKENGDVKFKPEFEKKGTHLKEDDIEGAEAGVERVEEAPMGEFEAKFAAIGKAIDAKLAAEMGGSAPAAVVGMADEPKDDDFEEVEVGVEKKDGEEMDETKMTVKEEVPASQHLNPEDAMKASTEDSNLKGEVQESVDEPIEGHSVAQETEADKVNDNMEKDTHVKESAENKGEVITEGKTTKGNLFTEGLDDKKKASLLAEMHRMSKFAGLTKDDDEK